MRQATLWDEPASVEEEERPKARRPRTVAPAGGHYSVDDDGEVTLRGLVVGRVESRPIEADDTGRTSGWFWVSADGETSSDPAYFAVRSTAAALLCADPSTSAFVKRGGIVQRKLVLDDGPPEECQEHELACPTCRQEVPVPDKTTWLTGMVLHTDPRVDARAFTTIIRWHGDPERRSRKERQELLGGEEAATDWLSLKKGAPEVWRDSIAELLGDGKPRTFNGIMLALSDYMHTADTALDMPPHHGLALAVRSRAVMMTNDAPVFFALSDERAMVPLSALEDAGT